MASRPRVLYFFAFRSPYAALANFRIDDLVGDAGGKLEAIPVLPPDSLTPVGEGSPLADIKMEYLREDAERWARRLHIPWCASPPGPGGGRETIAGYYYAKEHGQERHFRNAVFRSRWCEGKDINDLDVLAECAEDCRLSPNRFLQALRTKLFDPPVDSGLARCIEHKVFGVPTFIYDGQRFWGNDRLDLMIDALRRDTRE